MIQASSIFERLLPLLCKVSPHSMDSNDIQMQTLLKDELGLGSLQLTGLMFLCEKHFSMEFAPQVTQLHRVTHVSDLVGLIKKYQHEEASQA